MKKELTKQNVKDEIKQFTCIHPDTGCWEWNRGGNGKGYGMTKYSGKMYLIHRLSAADHSWNLQDSYRKGRNTRMGINNTEVACGI